MNSRPIQWAMGYKRLHRTLKNWLGEGICYREADCIIKSINNQLKLWELFLISCEAVTFWRSLWLLLIFRMRLRRKRMRSIQQSKLWCQSSLWSWMLYQISTSHRNQYVFHMISKSLITSDYFTCSLVQWKLSITFCLLFIKIALWRWTTTKVHPLWLDEY